MPKYNQDKRNANRGTERGRELLKQSLSRLGPGRSILVDKHGTAIAGNKTLAEATSQGIPTVEVETDGKTLVVVKRTDLDLETDNKARELAFADNRVAELDLDWDTEVLKTDLDILQSDFLDELWKTEIINSDAQRGDEDKAYSLWDSLNKDDADKVHCVIGTVEFFLSKELYDKFLSKIDYKRSKNQSEQKDTRVSNIIISFFHDALLDT